MARLAASGETRTPLARGRGGECRGFVAIRIFVTILRSVLGRMLARGARSSGPSQLPGYTTVPCHRPAILTLLLPLLFKSSDITQEVVRVVDELLLLELIERRDLLELDIQRTFEDELRLFGCYQGPGLGIGINCAGLVDVLLELVYSVTYSVRVSFGRDRPSGRKRGTYSFLRLL